MPDNLLSLLIFVPLLAGLLVLTFPIGREAARSAGLAVSVIALTLGLKIFFDFEGLGEMEFSEFHLLLPEFGINYSLAVDGISVLVLMTSACLFPLVYMLLATKNKGFYGNLLLVQGAMNGAIVSTNLMLFYVFWEVMLLPVFFMIGLYGGPQRMAATLKITLYTIAGSLLMLVGILYLGNEFHHQHGVWTFAIEDLESLQLTGSTATLAFFFFMLAFAIKIPLFPFHTWLPDAYTEAPVAVTFLLSAIMAKIGVYAVIRFVMPIFEAELARYALLFAYAGVIGMMYCGVAAMAQKDFKRMLAFSSASHMGIIALGIFCLNLQALTGTIYQIVAHATSTGVLFVLLGIVEERTQTRTISDLGGIAGKAPVFAFFFAVTMLASVGLPGTSGFVGEFLIILGAVQMHTTIGILAATTLIIGVCYMLWLFQKVFFEKDTPRTTSFQDLTAMEICAVLPVVVLILIMGIYPQPFLQKVVPTAQIQLESVVQPVHQLAQQGITKASSSIER